MLLAAGSPPGNETDDFTLRESAVELDSNGLVKGHAYSILRVEEEHDMNGTHQLLQLRDPWGVTKWSGAWCDHDKKRWTKRMQTRLNHKVSKETSTMFSSWFSSKRKTPADPVDERKDDEDDGSFWISLVDFTKEFKWLYICQLFDPNDWNHKSVNGSWIGQGAGGPPNQPGARFNPQFKLQFHKSTTANIWLFVSITNLTSIEEMRDKRNHCSELDSEDGYERCVSSSIVFRDCLTHCFSDIDGNDAKEMRKTLRSKRTYPYMSLLLLDLDGHALEDDLVASQVVASTGKYKNSRELSLETKLPHNLDKKYTLFPSLYPSGEEGLFLINVYSSAPFKLSRIPLSP